MEGRSDRRTIYLQHPEEGVRAIKEEMVGLALKCEGAHHEGTGGQSLALLFEKLKVVNTTEIVKKTVNPVVVKKEIDQGCRYRDSLEREILQSSPHYLSGIYDMKHLRWQNSFGISLIALSAVSLFYPDSNLQNTQRHLLLSFFRTSHLSLFQVLMVTMIIDQVLRIREKRSLLKKMNMVIGAFFSEVGTDLLKSFAHFDLHYETLSRNLIISDKWSESGFLSDQKTTQRIMITSWTAKKAIWVLKSFLTGKREVFCSDFWKTRICWSMNPLQIFSGLYFI